MDLQTDTSIAPPTIATMPCDLAEVAPSEDSAPAKVLHVINGEYYSGAERVQDLLAGGLPKAGFAVGFACVKPARFPKVRLSQAPLFETAMRHRLDFTPAWQVARIVRREGYSLIHAHTPRSALIGRLAAHLCHVPFVYHVHSPTVRDSTNRVRNWLNAAHERLSLRGANGLITVSRSLSDHMQSSGYADELITVVPNGVPAPSQFRGATPPAATWTIGTVALFRPRKGLEVLLEALRRLRVAGADVRLRAVGPFESEDYRQSISASVDAMSLGDAIDWIGFTDNVAAELAQMDMFVLPSLFGEGLPMVVLEAMAAGVPVIATRVQGVPEAIEHGVSGLLADPGDAEQLAGQMQDLVTGRRDWATIREQARRRQAEHFSDQAMAAGVAAVYRRVLSKEQKTGST